MMIKWAVKTADYYNDECYKDSLETSIKLFDTEKEAIDELMRIIRNDWTTEVYVGGEVKSLADCRGMSEYESSKYSQWSYSGDGKIAWAFDESGSGHKGEVVEVAVGVDLSEDLARDNANDSSYCGPIIADEEYSLKP